MPDTISSTASTPGIKSAFENLALNFAGGLGAIGLGKLQQAAGIGAPGYAQQRGQLLTPTSQLQAAQVNQASLLGGSTLGPFILVVLVGGLVIGVIVLANRKK